MVPVTDPAIDQSDATADPNAGRTITRREIYDLVWSQPMTAVAAALGLSANGLAKICDRLLIPYPTRGYWAKIYAGKDQAQVALPDPPENLPEDVTIASGRSVSRRPRKRLSREDRRSQLLARAEALVRDEGVHAFSMKRIARDLGMSEAQTYNYFCSAAELLAAIARAELTAMNLARMAASRTSADPQMRYALTAVAYLRQVSKRGELLQQLLAVPDVRAILRAEHEDRRAVNHETLGTVFREAYGVPPEISTIVGAMLTALSLRAGRMMARGKIDLDTAERLVMPISAAGVSAMIRRHGHGERPA